MPRNSSNFPIGMNETERDIYEIARYVRMPGDRIEPFVKVMEMCGYEIVKRSEPQQSLHSEKP